MELYDEIGNRESVERFVRAALDAMAESENGAYPEMVQQKYLLRALANIEMARLAVEIMGNS